jgi:cysteine desulfurase
MNESKSHLQVYLDCNATTPVFKDAARAALEAMQRLYGNPSSTHQKGVQAKAILESTRKVTATLIGAQPEEIIFTSGATEGIQTAVFSALQYWKIKSPHQRFKVLYGSTEHKAVPEAIYHWVKVLDLEYEIIKLPVDTTGRIVLSSLQAHLEDTALLCTMAVNNETGVIQDLGELEKALIHSGSQALWMVDCVQALGKQKINLNQTRIDYAPFSGHKLYAPKGIGFLYKKRGAPFTPLLVGGGQESGLRSGTENLPGVAALEAVLKHFLIPSAELRTHDELISFRDQLLGALKKNFPKLELNTPLEHAVPTTLNFSVPGLQSAELLALFDSAGIRVSSGSACSSSSAKPSFVLQAMGVPTHRASSALRLSFGPFTTAQEIDQSCQLIEDSARALQNTCILESPEPFLAPHELREGVIHFKSGANNTWLIVHESSCIVIDPCEEIHERIEHYIRCQDLKPIALLDTHHHADHESMRTALQKALIKSSHSPHAPQEDSLGWPSTQTFKVRLQGGLEVQALSFPLDEEPFPLVLARLETPGHTRDSVTYLYGRLMDGEILDPKNIHCAFTGDTLLSGGLGRTNFSVSDSEALFHSLRKLSSVVHEDTLLCPAHDYDSSFATTLRVETQENALLREALHSVGTLALPSFLQKKYDLDLQLGSLEQSFQAMVCGVTPSKLNLSTGGCPSLDLRSERVPSFAQSHFWMIDVRETQEHLLFKDWSRLGLRSKPRNVPLSRIVNFMRELQQQPRSSDPEKQPQIILFCRTGNRSLQAAKSLRRLGFPNVWSIQGGVALWTSPLGL